MDLIELRDELKVIHDKRIKLSMLKEQAVAKCQEIEKKIGLNLALQFKHLVVRHRFILQENQWNMWEKINIFLAMERKTIGDYP